MPLCAVVRFVLVSFASGLGRGVTEVVAGRGTHRRGSTNVLCAMASSRTKVRPATTACARTGAQGWGAQGCTARGQKRGSQQAQRVRWAQRVHACIIELATMRSCDPMPLAKA